nr:hypothetical protein Iba_chr12cCG11890 [Ipomoea batatas]
MPEWFWFSDSIFVGTKEYVVEGNSTREVDAKSLSLESQGQEGLKSLVADATRSKVPDVLSSQAAETMKSNVAEIQDQLPRLPTPRYDTNEAYKDMTSFLVADDFEGSHDDGGKREAPHMDSNSNDSVEYVQEHVHTQRPIQQDHAIDLMM